MPRNAASTRFLDDLARNEAMPHPLAGYVLYERECGLSEDERLLLAAALEGCCGIPAAHRETTTSPPVAAYALASGMLIGNTRRWSIQEVSRYTARLGQLETPAELLHAWCVLRATHRAKERQEAAGKVRFADGAHFSMAELTQLSKAH